MSCIPGLGMCGLICKDFAGARENIFEAERDVTGPIRHLGEEAKPKFIAIVEVESAPERGVVFFRCQAAHENERLTDGQELLVVL